MKKNLRTASTHPYVERRSDTANGKAIMVGTRIKVSQIALEYEQLIDKPFKSRTNRMWIGREPMYDF